MIYDSLLIKLFVIEIKNTFDHMLRTQISSINEMTASLLAHNQFLEIERLTYFFTSSHVILSFSFICTN